MGGKSAENPKFLRREMMGAGMKILISMSLFPKDLVTDTTIISPREENVEKGKATILLNFHCELDGV